MRKISNLEGIEHIYMVGIKGSGMTALAEIFKIQGKKVSGSDVKEIFLTDKILEKIKIKIYSGFKKENLRNRKNVNLVVYSTAYNFENNPELQLAKEKGYPILSYPEALSLLFNSKFGIAICGTHGKTTTTAMLALLMKDADLKPTALVGSKIKQLNASVLVGDSDYMIIEADEYQNKLAHYKPQKTILTSLDFDHPDYFKNFEEYKKVFKDFVKKIPATGTLVAWGESAFTLEVALEARCKVVLYGFFQKNSGIEGDIEIDEASIYEIKEKFEQASKKIPEFFVVPQDLKLKVAGKHNLLNATACLAMAKDLKISREIALNSLNNFEGTARRMEIIGKRKGALIIDDYAHHPEEVKVTLQALKDKYSNKNLICIFHPHTFTRTKALFSEFAQSFDKADEVIVLDIYGSAREKQGGTSSKKLVEKMKMFHQKVCHLKNLDDAFEDLKDRIGGEDIVVTMGAGNVCDLANKLVNKK
jgi:UDP-N-acetylmuramate--alanine ligase